MSRGPSSRANAPAGDRAPSYTGSCGLRGKPGRELACNPSGRPLERVATSLLVDSFQESLPGPSLPQEASEPGGGRTARKPAKNNKTRHFAKHKTSQPWAFQRVAKAQALSLFPNDVDELPRPRSSWAGRLKPSRPPCSVSKKQKSYEPDPAQTCTRLVYTGPFVQDWRHPAKAPSEGS